MRQSFFERLRRTLIGAPIASARAHHEKLSPFLGLPVFSSDALSSVAYATEAILSILILKGIGALSMQFAITASICVLIVMIGISYTQTIYAYPKGGGSYIVASDNLGTTPGLVAGAALMIDYILTVSVSISAGVAAFVSAYPHLHPYLVEISVTLVILVAWLNLRGVRESGAVFAFPTYGFILGILATLGMCFYRVWHDPPHIQAVVSNQAGKELEAAWLYITLRAFAAGCTALTGIEAVSDGVQSFKDPAAKNARIVLQRMTILLIIMFLGIGFLSQHIPTLALYTNSDPRYTTLTSQLASFAFGRKSIGFYYVQFATMAILILAANTAFADFPRVASFLARDGFLPRPFARQGDRLVFHNGIILLGLAAAALVGIFHGELDQLLPLYAIGVFTAFTLSQSGMVAHWLKVRTPGWRRSMAINIVGTILTGVVTAIILITKFLEGAWIAAVLIIVVFFLFKSVKRRYQHMSMQLAMDASPPPPTTTHTSLLLVPRVHKGIVKALTYAKTVDPNCVALHVTLDERTLPQVQRDWERYGQGVPLVVLNSPYRSLIRPVLDYVDQLLEQDPGQLLTFIVAEPVSSKWYQKFLHENVAAQLKSALAQRRNVAVTNVRYFLD
jgi:amino acid transporter